MSNFPLGWHKATLGAVSEKPQYGWTTKANHETGKLKLLRTTDITSGMIDWSTVPYCTDEPDDIEKYLIKSGDILISRAGSIGVSFLINKPERAVFASYLIRFRIKNSYNKKYVYFYLKSPDYWKAIGASKVGIAVPNVNATKLAQVPIPIASDAVQKLIVSEIEKQFSRLDEAVAGLKRIKANLKRYKASVLKAAVEGKLTEEWRENNKDVEHAEKLLKRILAERKKKWEEKNPGKKYKEPVAPDTSNLPELPKGWVWATTDQLFSFVTSGSRGWASYYSNSGPLFLRMGNLDHDTINLDLSDIQRVQPPKGTEGTRTRVMSGDILISITADVGMVGLVPDGFEEAYINQHVALARPESALNNIFLAWFLACKNGQDQLRGLQRGATKVGLGLEDIKAVNVPLPPLKEQAAIIQEVERLFSVDDEIEAVIETNLKRSERLRQTILKKAFLGRLI